MIGSPYYWAFVTAITLAFAVIDLEALRRRSMSRFHGASVAVYVCAWVIVVGLAFTPLGSVGWVFPAALRIAVVVIFVGGQLLAEGVRAERQIGHPERRPDRTPRLRDVPEAELRAGDAFDAQWQVEDRERNRAGKPGAFESSGVTRRFVIRRIRDKDESQGAGD